MTPKPTGKFILGAELYEDFITQTYCAETRIGPILIRFLPGLHKGDSYWSANLMHKQPDFRWINLEISFKGTDFDEFLMRLQSHLLREADRIKQSWDLYDEKWLTQQKEEIEADE